MYDDDLRCFNNSSFDISMPRGMDSSTVPDVYPVAEVLVVSIVLTVLNVRVVSVDFRPFECPGWYVLLSSSVPFGDSVGDVPSLLSELVMLCSMLSAESIVSSIACCISVWGTSNPISLRRIAGTNSAAKCNWPLRTWSLSSHKSVTRSCLPVEV
jgi:hypothetical protein